MRQEFKFYFLCLSWAMSCMWQERRELSSDLFGAIRSGLGSDKPPPLNSKDLADDLRPFCYVLVLSLIWSFGSMAITILTGPAGPVVNARAAAAANVSGVLG